MPRSEKVLDIRGDLLLARRTDELDVETVVLYRMGVP